MKIPLSNPDINQKEIEAVIEVLKTSHLSLGPKLKEFEQAFATYTAVKHAVAVNSGTSGLHLAVRALNLGKDDEVITTPFSFISSSNCILFERAKPVFVDIDSETYNIDVNKIHEKITRKTKAILPVHIFGFPCDMEKIMAIAKEHKLAVIEDACESIGAEIDKKKVGSFGNCSVMAFYPNKQITTGEGGILLTNDDKIAKLVVSMRNQGRCDGLESLVHSRLGYNYRLSDINCSLGITQLKRIDEILSKREKVAKLYSSKLSKSQYLILPKQQAHVKRSWFVYVVRLVDSFSEQDRNMIITRLKQEGIGCNCYFFPIHLQPFYRKLFNYRHGDFPMTEHVSSRTVALPFFNNLKESQINYVVMTFKKIIEEVKR